eukprot:NODE_384_length_2323_cov_178.257696_g356_i0.p1 GENE.NODE_384_length_2323_cov_178.257696_g356_i0~~NODE_384_length_2323_cov_178.257696_g356_i0.p1  ORF type:complete len:713 (-),score=117.60 NODE_384_length_2323_cov_178.257696_g356_i0:118-2256(-)
MMRVTILLLSAVMASAFTTPYNVLEFSSWDTTGRNADPCHASLVNGEGDCGAMATVPVPSVTVLAPSATSITNSLVGTASTIFGHAISGANPMVALSTPGQGCLSIDATTTTGATIAADGTSLSWSFDASWFATALEFEAEPRAVCFHSAPGATWRYTGFYWKVVWSCNSDANNRQCPPPVASTDARLATIPVADRAVYDTNLMNSTVRAWRNAQTACCDSGASFAAQCINPNEKSCCGATAFRPAIMNCCSTSRGTVQFYDKACPCYRSTSEADCLAAGQTCCLPTKYPELSISSNRDQVGECYNSSVHQCCDTGRRFDAGSQQCCVVNGLQSLDIPCPCNTDEHCAGDWADSTDDAHFQCCRQSFPRSWESAFEARSGNSVTAGSASTSATCDKYANYPTGTASFEVQPCLGSCYDSRYLTCCNGRSCVQEYERCCNTTCCPKYTSACQQGRRPVGGADKWQNGNDYSEEFSVCTQIEQMNTFKAFWVFVLPFEMLFAVFLGLALALGFASHANTHNPRSYIFIERFMIALAILTVFFAIPYFFSPLYKYGIVQALVALVVIITAAARLRWLNFLAIVLQGIFLIYLIDPFHGSAYFTLASGRHVSGVIDSETAGVLHLINKTFTSTRDPSFCTDWYDYFRFDPAVQDFDRFDNPLVTTFGYCSRAWVMALYLFTGGTILFSMVQFVTLIIAVLLRFKKRYDVQLEVHKQ